MARDTWKVWQERVEQWRASGLTAESYAESRGFKPGTLRHWSWKLRVEKHGWRSRSCLKAPAFVEIAVPPRSSAPPPSVEVVDGLEPLEIVLDKRVCIRVPPRFDQAVLVRLLSALEAR